MTDSPPKTGWQTVADKKIWQLFLERNPQLEANFTQSFNWGVFYERLDRRVFRRGYFQKGRLIAGYTAVLETGKWWSCLNIAGGPLLDWTNKKLILSFKADILAIARKQKCCFIRLRPAVADSPQMRKILKTLDLRPSPMGLSVEFAGLLDLTLSDEQLLANMNQSLRRKIRKAQKDRQIEIRVSKAKSDAQLFAKLHLEHAQRQQYVPFSISRLTTQFEVFSQDDQALLYIAQRDNQILAANMIFFYSQEASYHFGISTSLGQKYSSAPLLHLAAIKEAKKRGLKIYNFWGIVKPDEVNHRYFGLSQFKRSFGIIEHHYVPAHDLVCRRGLYVLTHLFESWQRKKRRL